MPRITNNYLHNVQEIVVNLRLTAKLELDLIKVGDSIHHLQPLEGGRLRGRGVGGDARQVVGGHGAHARLLRAAPELHRAVRHYVALASVQLHGGGRTPHGTHLMGNQGPRPGPGAPGRPPLIAVGALGRRPEGGIAHHHQEGNFRPDCGKQSPEWTQGLLEEDEDIHWDWEADAEHGQGEETPPATIIALVFPAFAVTPSPSVLHEAEEDGAEEPGEELRHDDGVDEVVDADPVQKLVILKLGHRLSSNSVLRSLDMITSNI